MTKPIILDEVAIRIAHIAAATKDPATAKQLLDLVNEMLTKIGSPPAH